MSEIDSLFYDSNMIQISNTALIVVDVQNDFCHSEGAFSKYKKVYLGHINKAVEKIYICIEKCKELGLPIIFIETIHSPWTNSYNWLARMKGSGKGMHICLPNRWGSDFYKVIPKKDDCIVIKHRYSAFVSTNLDLILRSRGIENIMVAGVVTNVCVETTARDGFNRDYNVILLEDCCGAFDDSEHDATLRNISRYFGTVTTSALIIENLKTIN